MLVLSRGEQEKLVFPSLGITVQVVRVDGKQVRLGVEAPRDVPVLRHELAEQWNEWRDYPVGTRPGTLQHALRNRLNAATLGLNLLHRQLETGRLENTESTIFKVFRELASMEKELVNFREVGATGPDSAPPRRALLVEGSDNESELLAGYLRTCNFDVVRARDGADALEYLACHESPDVVLIDLEHPRQDGCAAIDEIRGHPSHAGLKIFALTGGGPQGAGVSLGCGGVDRWFAKPIQPDLLVSEIDRELAKVAV